MCFIEKMGQFCSVETSLFALVTVTCPLSRSVSQYKVQYKMAAHGLVTMVERLMAAPYTHTIHTSRLLFWSVYIGSVHDLGSFKTRSYDKVRVRSDGPKMSCRSSSGQSGAFNPRGKWVPYVRPPSPRVCD